MEEKQILGNLPFEFIWHLVVKRSSSYVILFVIRYVIIKKKEVQRDCFTQSKYILDINRIMIKLVISRAIEYFILTSC